MAHALPNALTAHRRETAIALALSALALLTILLAGSLIVIFDLQGLQGKVEAFLDVDLTAPNLSESRTEYASESARNLSERLIEDTRSGLFGNLPGDAEDQPEARPFRPLDMERLPPLRHAPAPTSTEHLRPHFREGERALVRALTGTNLPVVEVRAADGPARSEAPAIFSSETPSASGLARLGSPGEIRLHPEPPDMPDAPLMRDPNDLGRAIGAFPRDEDAAVIGRRLVRERPAAGYPSLDDDIKATFDVYRQPGAKKAYFRLTIGLRPESRLPSVPRDVLFLIDVSQSIGMGELRRMREAVTSYLSGLEKGARWNVAIFSESTSFLHEDAIFVPAARFDADTVGNFIDKRRGQRRTDVFLATQTVLGRIPASNRPCSVFLISDGKATEGTSDVRRIVNNFQRVNRDNFAIFTFNAGPGGNVYLLSLLSYRSRGFFQAEPDLEKAPRALIGFAQAFDHPVLTNVVANYTNIKTEDVHPVVLPNLYRGAPITFWGRTTPGREVALRVAGLSTGGPREFFFRTQVPEGDDSDPEILREWARGKAHALMAELADDPENEELRKRILALATQQRLSDIVSMVEKKGLIDLLPWK